MSDKDRIHKLETENARLRGVVGRAGIVLATSIELPDDKQVADLIAMIARAHPKLAVAGDAVAFGDQVRASIFSSSFLRRSATPNADHYPHFWRDEAQLWLREQGYGAAPISLGAFIVGAIANGVTYARLEQPKYCSLGFARGTTAKPIAMWEFVLKAGVPAPVKIVTQRPVEVTQLNMIRPSV
jgi:hypothetical protein